MNWLSLFIKFLPAAIQFARLAEDTFSEPKSGQKKKEFVMGATAAIVGSMHSVSRGGQKETWAKMAGPMSAAIDIACRFMFR